MPPPLRRASRVGCALLFGWLVLCGAPRALHAQATKLVGASSDNFPPINFLDRAGTLKGFGRDLSEAVARAIGAEIEHIHSPRWVEVLGWLERGDADFIHDVGYTEERTEQLDFTRPLFEMPEVIFVKHDEFAITGLESLFRKRVVCVDRHITHLYLQRFEEIELVVVSTPEEAIYELISGRVDALIYPKQVALFLFQTINLDDQVKIVGDPVRILNWSMAVKKGNARTLAILNHGIKEIKSSGEYHRIYKKWWGDETRSSKKTLSKILWYSLIVFGVSLLLRVVTTGIVYGVRLKKKQGMLESEIERHKETENKLRESQENFDQIAEAIKEVFWIGSVDREDIFYVSPGYEDVWGYPIHSLIKNPMVWFDYVHPDDQIKVIKDLEKTNLEAGEIPTASEYRIIHADGSIRWINARAFPIFDSDHKVTRVAGLAEDITNRKRNEEERHKLESELLQSHKMESIGTLAGGIAHDFNNILAAIIGYTEMVREELEPGSENRAFLGEVLKSSHRAKDLVQQILTFSRKSPESITLIRPIPVIEEALKLIRASLPATVEIREDLGVFDDAILANTTQLHQVVYNLCTNALHSMDNERGVITIEADLTCFSAEELAEEPEVEAGRFIELAITDTGSGMSPELLKAIFEPYFTTKEIGRGSGMGLAVVHGIMKSYRGFIRVTSELGVGSTFKVYFPVAAGEAPRLEAEPTATHLPLPTGDERILVVDDEGVILSMYEAVLSKLGYRVVARQGGEAALEALRAAPEEFDLLVTDQSMPRMSGFELAKAALEIRPDMPIILCTGYSSVLTEEKVKRAGITQLFFKPLRRKDLVAGIRDALDASGA